jgi:hypothetical protein
MEQYGFLDKVLGLFDQSRPSRFQRQHLVLHRHPRNEMTPSRVLARQPEAAPPGLRKVFGFSADSDEAGQALQYEAGHRFQYEAGQGSDLMSAT